MRYARIAAAAAASAALVLAGAPAQAAPNPPFHENWSEQESHIEQDAHPDFCPDIEDDILFEADLSGTFTAVWRGGELAYATATFNVTESYTNLATGKSFTGHVHGVDHDLDVVDNGDGTLTVTTTTQQSVRYVTDDGRTAFVDAGHFEYRLLIDHNGTPGDPSDDEVIDFLGEDAAHGHFDTQGRDFCEDLEMFTS
ncbi:hypothetical protein GCM10009819_16960 [Agromyces tropicus]|uniref:Uncharacterized protein n=1 Tax=Agromyces tropicus TaxID=555371 RepID=A0ABP5FW14_9MICO